MNNDYTKIWFDKLEEVLVEPWAEHEIKENYWNSKSGFEVKTGGFRISLKGQAELEKKMQQGSACDT